MLLRIMKFGFVDSLGVLSVSPSLTGLKPLGKTCERLHKELKVSIQNDE